MAVTTLLAGDSEKYFICLQWLGLNSVGRVIVIISFSWHLLLNKITKEMSFFVPK